MKHLNETLQQTVKRLMRDHALDYMTASDLAIAVREGRREEPPIIKSAPASKPETLAALADRQNAAARQRITKRAKAGSFTLPEGVTAEPVESIHARTKRLMSERGLSYVEAQNAAAVEQVAALTAPPEPPRETHPTEPHPADDEHRALLDAAALAEERAIVLRAFGMTPKMRTAAVAGRLIRRGVERGLAFQLAHAAVGRAA